MSEPLESGRNSPYARRSCRISLLILCMLLFIYRFFRSGEVTSIRSHIKFLEDHMIIKVEKSKTDQLRFLASR